MSDNIYSAEAFENFQQLWERVNYVVERLTGEYCDWGLEGNQVIATWTTYDRGDKFGQDLYFDLDICTGTLEECHAKMELFQDQRRAEEIKKKELALKQQLEEKRQKAAKKEIQERLLLAQLQKKYGT